MPERSDGYQLPSWPKTPIDRKLWNSTMSDIHARLSDREELEASFESLKAQGIQASLDYIQVNVAPQIANLQQSITLAQDQIDQIIIGGSAPNALKFGNQLPAYYATAASLSEGLAGKVPNTRKVNGKELSEDITLAKSDVGLGNVNNTADTDKPISTDQAAALANRVRVDAAQEFTASEKGRARANIGGGVLAGHRNKIINGDFDICQRALSQTTAGYGSDDRWDNSNAGTTKTHSIQAFTLGQTSVPGEPKNFSRTVVTSVAGANNYCNKIQRVEGVRSLAGRRVTLTFYAKADAAKNIAVELLQWFGSGGSPSDQVSFGITTCALTPGWKRFDIVVDVPPIAGKTIGTSGTDHLGVVFWLEAGSSLNARTNNLGQQSGTFDIAHVSLVEGDAAAEGDPLSPRHPQQELALCQRYFERGANGIDVYEVAGGNSRLTVNYKVSKRAVPSIGQIDGGAINFTATMLAPNPSAERFDCGRVKDGATGKGAWTNIWTADAEL